MGEAFRDAVEGEIDINFLVIAAVKRASRRMRETAGGLRLAREKHQFEFDILLAALSEDLTPTVFSAAAHARDELAALIADARLARARHRLRYVGLQVALLDCARVDAKEERDQHQRDTADATAGDGFGNAKAAPIFDVLTFLFVVKPNIDSSLKFFR